MSITLVNSGGIEAKTSYQDLEDSAGLYRLSIGGLQLSMAKTVVGLEKSIRDEKLSHDLAIDGLMYYVAAMRPRRIGKQLKTGRLYCYQLEPNPNLKLVLPDEKGPEILFEDLTIERDLMALTSYVLTNTRLIGSDPRTDFVESIRQKILQPNQPRIGVS